MGWSKCMLLNGFSLLVQVQTELLRKFRSWRTESEIVCCGQWLAVLEPREGTFSIATVPDCNRSSVSRAMPDSSPSLESSQIFRCAVQPNSPQMCASLTHFPLTENRDNTFLKRDNETGQSSVAMQVSFLIHFKDPVELLPHVVNTDSDWIHCCICCGSFWFAECTNTNMYLLKLSEIKMFYIGFWML